MRPREFMGLLLGAAACPVAAWAHPSECGAAGVLTTFFVDDLEMQPLWAAASALPCKRAFSTNTRTGEAVGGPHDVSQRLPASPAGD